VSHPMNTMKFVSSATASSSRSDDDVMSVTSWRRSDKEIDAVPPPPFGLMGVASDLCVARRRRCPCITSSSLLDLPSQNPSANIMVFMGRDTNPDYASILYCTDEIIRRAAPPSSHDPQAGTPPRVAQRTQVGAFVVSRQEPMHNSGYFF